MATTTPNFGWPVPTSTDLVKDGATAIESLGDSIDASLLDLKGGTTGQILTKNSNTDMDFTWSSESGDISAVNVTSPINGGGSSGAVTIGIDSTAVVPSQTGNSGKFLTTNGSTSSWGTVSAPTAIAGAYATVATDESTSSTSFTNLTTSGPAATVTTGTRALVIVSSSIRSTIAGAQAQMSFSVSGATTRAVQTNEYGDTSFGSGGAAYNLGIRNVNSSAILVTGLTAGSNVFTAKYAAPAGDTCSFSFRKITVIDLGS